MLPGDVKVRVNDDNGDGGTLVVSDDTDTATDDTAGEKQIQCRPQSKQTCNPALGSKSHSDGATRGRLLYRTVGERLGCVLSYFF